MSQNKAHQEYKKTNSHPLFISSIKDYTMSIFAMHKNRMLHSQAYTRYFLPTNKSCKQLFIAKYVSCKAHL